MTEGKGGAACWLSGSSALPLLIPSSLRAHRLLPHGSPAMPAARPSWGHSKRLQETRASTSGSAILTVANETPVTDVQWMNENTVHDVVVTGNVTVCESYRPDGYFLRTQPSINWSIYTRTDGFCLILQPRDGVVLHWHSDGHRRKCTATN